MTMETLQDGAMVVILSRQRWCDGGDFKSTRRWSCRPVLARKEETVGTFCMAREVEALCGPEACEDWIDLSLHSPPLC